LGWRGNGCDLSQQGLHRNSGDDVADVSSPHLGKAPWGPGQATPRSIRYTASYKAAKAGKYLVLTARRLGKSLKVSADGKQTLGSRRTPRVRFPPFWTLDLKAGQTVNVQADYLPGTGRVRAWHCL
jgi:hypothetical protein